jgi:ABC-2 type transport system permease protein
MRNILAIANKELRSYFASPIGYITIGLFALLYGFFYVTLLSYFLQQTMQIDQIGASGGPQTANVNQMMIRPVLQNLTIVMLFVLPMITMRTYSEEKRSGTIELLLTSPLTDFEIIMGKFLGAFSLFAVMLAVSLVHLGLLFAYGAPEWKPIVTAYVGLALLGGCIISLGLFISSLTKNQVVSGMLTFSAFLLLWVITWIGNFAGPTMGKIAQYVSVIDHLDDFTKGVIDTSHVIYYVSFIAFGLFLTAKSVDSERWRG